MIRVPGYLILENNFLIRTVSWKAFGIFKGVLTQDGPGKLAGSGKP